MATRSPAYKSPLHMSDMVQVRRPDGTIKWMERHIAESKAVKDLDMKIVGQVDPSFIRQFEVIEPVVSEDINEVEVTTDNVVVSSNDEEEGATLDEAVETITDLVSTDVKPKGKGGRPKGSKNK